jgi:hypothetical protein
VAACLLAPGLAGPLSNCSSSRHIRKPHQRQPPAPPSVCAFEGYPAIAGSVICSPRRSGQACGALTFPLLSLYHCDTPGAYRGPPPQGAPGARRGRPARWQAAAGRSRQAARRGVPARGEWLGRSYGRFHAAWRRRALEPVEMADTPTVMLGADTAGPRIGWAVSTVYRHPTAFYRVRGAGGRR